MFGKKLGIGTGIAAALVVVALEVPAGAQRQSAPIARAAISADPPAWLTGMRVRSEALNGKYNLVTSTRSPASASNADWLVALSIRSDALNRMYRLGAYAR